MVLRAAFVIFVVTLMMASSLNAQEQQQDDAVHGIFAKLPILKPFMMLGAKDPRYVARFMATNVGKKSAKIATDWMNSFNKYSNLHSIQTNEPALLLPPEIETELQNHQQEWFQAMGDGSLPTEWKKAIFPENGAIPTTLQQGTVSSIQNTAATSTQQDNIPPFQTPSHRTLEGIRRTVGVYAVASRALNLILGVYLFILITKVAYFRPAGIEKDDWGQMAEVARWMEKAKAIGPVFLPGLLFLLASKNQLDNAQDYVQKFFTDPQAEKNPDSLFPIGDGQFFLQ